MTRVQRPKLQRVDMMSSRPALNTVWIDLVDSGGPANGPRYAWFSVWPQPWLVSRPCVRHIGSQCDAIHVSHELLPRRAEIPPMTLPQSSLLHTSMRTAAAPAALFFLENFYVQIWCCVVRSCDFSAPAPRRGTWTWVLSRVCVGQMCVPLVSVCLWYWEYVLAWVCPSVCLCASVHRRGAARKAQRRGMWRASFLWKTWSRSWKTATVTSAHSRSPSARVGLWMWTVHNTSYRHHPLMLLHPQLSLLDLLL